MSDNRTSIVDGRLPHTVPYYDRTSGCEPVNVLIPDLDGLAVGTIDNNANIVVRWNGSDDKKNGYPTCRRGPTWMCLPDSITSTILSALLSFQSKRVQEQRIEMINKNCCTGSPKMYECTVCQLASSDSSIFLRNKKSGDIICKECESSVGIDNTESL